MSGSQPAKEPLAAPAGASGHPLHLVLVPVPIGAWVISVGFDVRSRLGPAHTEAAHTAWVLIVIGVVGAVLGAGGFLGGELAYRGPTPHPEEITWTPCVSSW